MQKLNMTLLLALWCGLATAGEQSLFTGKKQVQKIAVADEAQLIGVLQSDAGHKEKSDACRELARVGTAKAVPVLASLLSDEKLSHMARYGLEPIPCPAVDEALREALGTLKGLQLVGVISSIGVRRDEKAIAALAGLLTDADAPVPKAAARSLGKIGTEKAAEALEKALKRGPGASRLTVYEALLLCAESLAVKGNRDKAIAIYDSLRNQRKAPRHVRADALRGAVITRGKGGLPLLMEAVRSQDYGTVQAAARIALRMKEAGTSEALAGELEKLSDDSQVLLSNVLGARGDAVALPALYSLAKAGKPAARTAAILAAAEIGNAGSAPVLIELLKDPDKNIAAAAESALAGLRGAAVDDAVINLLDSNDRALKLRMISLVGHRRIERAVPLLAKLMDDREKDVRLAAIRSYGDIASAEDLPALLGKLVKETNPADIAALEKALSAVCGAPGASAAVEQKLVAALDRAIPRAKPALLRALRVAGGAGALKAVRNAVDDPDRDVHLAAIRVISEWRTPEAIPVLKELAENSADRIDKILSLRGYLGMAVKKEIPAKEKFDICRNAVTMIQRPEEKRMLLGALGKMPGAQSLNLIIPYIDDPAVKNEAVTTVMSIAKKRPGNKYTGPAKQALEKVVEAAADKPAIVKRARELLTQIEKEK